MATAIKNELDRQEQEKGKEAKYNHHTLMMPFVYANLLAKTKRGGICRNYYNFAS